MMRLKKILPALLLCGLLSTLVAACGIYDVSAKPVGPTVHMGAYHLYCTIHPGMNLTVIVK